MKKSVFIGLIVIVIISLSAFAVDLSEFPGIFTNDKDINKNVAIIVGKAAKTEDTIGAIDIATMLSKETSKNLDIAKMDNEVKSLSSYNSIVVGGPCANGAAAKLRGYPENCLEGFEIGKAILKFYEFDNGNIALLVAGTTALDTRRATYVLANYQDYELKGTEMQISGVSLSDVVIKNK